MKLEELEKMICNVEEYSMISIAYNKDLIELYKKIEKDKELFHHSKNVARLSCGVGLIYGFNLNELINLYTGALLHDIGKLKLNRKILYKKGIFTDSEKQYTETHPSIGYKLVKDLKLEHIITDIIKCHHEKLDGTGYPESLRGNELSIFVQIVTVADMYEAMVSDRCYRKALPMEAVFDILRKDNGINKVVLQILKNNVSHKEFCKANIIEMPEVAKNTSITGFSEKKIVLA